MKNIFTAFLFACMAVGVAAQPMIPPSNVSPITGPALVGRGAGSGRATTITLGSGLSITNNIITANGGGGGTGNVTAAASLDAGNIVIGQGASAVATSPTFSISGSNATVTGNLSVTGNLTVTGSQTVGNLITTNLTVTTNISSSGTTDGMLWIGSTASGNFTKATITAGDGIEITNAANSITINATATGSGSNLTMTATLGSDDTYTGSTLAGLNAGTTIAQWEAVYVGGSSTYLLANATATAHPAFGLAVAAYSNTNPAVVLREGPVRNDAWSWTPGGRIFLSTTAGALTQTAPSASTNIVQQVGVALTADIAYFYFASGEYVTVP